MLVNKNHPAKEQEEKQIAGHSNSDQGNEHIEPSGIVRLPTLANVGEKILYHGCLF